MRPWRLLRLIKTSIKTRLEYKDFGSGDDDLETTCMDLDDTDMDMGNSVQWFTCNYM